MSQIVLLFPISGSITLRRSIKTRKVILEDETSFTWEEVSCTDEGGNTEEIDYECTVGVTRENCFVWEVAEEMLIGGMEIHQDEIGVRRWSRKCERILKRIQPLFYLMTITWQLREQWGYRSSAQVPTIHFLVAIVLDLTGKTGNKFMERLEVAWRTQIFCKWSSPSDLMDDFCTILFCMKLQNNHSFWSPWGL